ncbi:MAG TPA: Uma2 family endonuclease [Gemmataceae bacterium]|jgi:Uma2 family endonuclease|nr:Uma2 family endonuclease [Gemmataceae bacterium]
MATAAQQLITAEQFLTLPGHPDGLKQELVRGEVVTMCVPGFDHGLIQGQVYAILREFVHANNLGRVTVESGVVTERGPDTVRGPDVAYWSAQRLPLDQRPRISGDGAGLVRGNTVARQPTRKGPR